MGRTSSQRRAGPFIRVRHSDALHTRALAILEAVDSADDATGHRDALADVILDLTDNAFDYCFMQPLRKTKPGLLVEQGASLGLLGVQQIVGPVVRQVLARMSSRQLKSVADSIRSFMV